jgi:hypothetical protein
MELEGGGCDIFQGEYYPRIQVKRLWKTMNSLTGLPVTLLRFKLGTPDITLEC